MRDWKRADYAKDPTRQRETDKRWRAANPERLKECETEWRDANRELLQERDRNRYWADPEKARERNRKWATENPEKRRAARDPDKFSHYTAKRKALLRERHVADVSFDAILCRDQGLCGICGKQIVDKFIELDHILPLAAGGWHGPDNVQLAHRTCNRRKHVNPEYRAA